MLGRQVISNATNTTAGTVTLDQVSAIAATAVAASRPVFTQNASSATWSINHNLNAFPSVSVKDSAGNAVEGAVDWIDANNLTITFSYPFSGQAFLN